MADKEKKQEEQEVEKKQEKVQEQAETLKKGQEEKTEAKENHEPEEIPADLNVDKLSEKKAKKYLKIALTDYGNLQNAYVELLKQSEEYKNDYLRARADCENVRKRKAEELSSAYAEAKIEAVTKVLAIGDSLDWALKMPLDDKTKEGIEKLVKKFDDILESLGVKEFSPEAGSDFDPNTAAAIMQVDGEGDEKSGTIKQVFGRGFKLGEKVIRYAQVSVVK